MLRNLIFDFGGVLINLDMEAVPRGLREFGVEMPQPGLLHLALQYEKGQIGSESFLEQAQGLLPGSHAEGIRRIWNDTIGDLPAYRLEFLESLKASGDYRMFLLSNTNALHMGHVRETMGEQEFRRLRNCFDGFYLSHEVGMRKPEARIFEFVLQSHGLKADETLFIDDTREHTDSAARLGIHTWHFQVGREDILELTNRLD